MQSAGLHGHATPTEGRCIWEWSQAAWAAVVFALLPGACSQAHRTTWLMCLHCFLLPATRLITPSGFMCLTWCNL